jgi:hypothetical protein
MEVSNQLQARAALFKGKDSPIPTIRKISFVSAGNQTTWPSHNTSYAIPAAAGKMYRKLFEENIEYFVSCIIMFRYLSAWEWRE